YPGTVLWGEFPVDDPAQFVRHPNGQEFHLRGDHRFRKVPFDADTLYMAITRTLAAVEQTETPPVWMLGGPSHTRLVTHYGGGTRGFHRARAMALVELGLPGLVCLDNGEELSLPAPVASRG